MKTLLIVLMAFLLIGGCKKEEAVQQFASANNIQNNDTLDIQACPNSTLYLKFYGSNCDSSVLDQFVGEWEIKDSVVLMSYRNGSSPVYTKIMGTFYGFIRKEVLPGTNAPSYTITNLWGSNESCSLFNNKDEVNIYSSLFPDYKGNTVRARDESQLDIPFKVQSDGSFIFKRKVNVYLGSGSGNSNYFYIQLKRR